MIRFDGLDLTSASLKVRQLLKNLKSMTISRFGPQWFKKTIIASGCQHDSELTPMASCSKKLEAIRCQFKECIRIQTPPTQGKTVVVLVVLHHRGLLEEKMIAVTQFQQWPFMRKVASVSRQVTFLVAQMEITQQVVATKSTRSNKNNRTSTSTQLSYRQWLTWEIEPD